MKRILLLPIVFSAFLYLLSACKDDEITPAVDPLEARRATQKVNYYSLGRNLDQEHIWGYDAPSGNIDDYTVDLGIGVRFATFNVGATEPAKSSVYAHKGLNCGDVYHWANWEPSYINGFYHDEYHYHYDPSNPNDKYNPECNGGLYYITGYCFDLCGEVIDCHPGQELDSHDDVASVRWGTRWGVPKPEDFETLYNNIDFSGDDDSKCLTAEWDNDNCILTVTNKTTKASVTFPFVHKEGDTFYYTQYWTNKLSNSSSLNAIAANISGRNLVLHDTKRCVPCFIRPVRQ